MSACGKSKTKYINHLQLERKSQMNFQLREHLMKKSLRGSRHLCQ